MSVDPEAAGLQGPVTTMVTRRIKPGRHAAYQAFLAGSNHAASALPGYLGMEVFCPPAAASTASSTPKRGDRALITKEAKNATGR